MWVGRLLHSLCLGTESRRPHSHGDVFRPRWFPWLRIGDERQTSESDRTGQGTPLCALLELPGVNLETGKPRRRSPVSPSLNSPPPPTPQEGQKPRPRTPAAARDSAPPQPWQKPGQFPLGHDPWCQGSTLPPPQGWHPQLQQPPTLAPPRAASYQMEGAPTRPSGCPQLRPCRRNRLASLPIRRSASLALRIPPRLCPEGVVLEGQCRPLPPGKSLEWNFSWLSTTFQSLEEGEGFHF